MFPITFCRLSVFVFVVLPVSDITHKIMNGLRCNLMDESGVVQGTSD